MHPTRKTRTITLTARPPVRIVEDDWPIIASASDYAGQVESQASEEWGVYVRQHEDGRRIAYAYRDRGTGGMPIEYRGSRGGELLVAIDDIAAAIRRVGDQVGIPEHTIADCIADLPAEDL
jgi:hypothetical protein